MHTLADLRAGKLAGSKRLDLSCGLTQFPEEIFTLSDTLQVLNLTGNQLSELPADLHRLTHLKILFCSDNLFTRLPECLGECSQLFFVGFKACRISEVSPRALPGNVRSLVLTDNCITTLPEEVGNLEHLQKLMMAGNRLQNLPASLVRCRKLELLRISANLISELPQWLLSMPALAWLAFAGNPLSDAHVEEPIRQIPWPQLSVDQLLGQGASGIIQQGQWRRENAVQDVAVKLYKGAVTSDGSPLNEMAACRAAGQHANLIPVEGQVVGHPDDAQGLVMQLIAPSFTILARPPSLESCTRDVYEAVILDASALDKIATGIAAACGHLHRRGINHGDLYGHNILREQDGNCLLGDFGAAAFYPDARTGRKLERIEVRAYGILLGELLACCEDITAQDRERWAGLEQDCVQEDVDKRPGFAEIEQRLRSGWASIP